MTGPFVPVGILNPIRAVVGIPHHRFNLFVKRSSAHPNVVQIHYACYDADRIYLAMPYYRKGSVTSLITDKYMTVREIVTVGCQVLSGLHNIHSKGLIHFDVKPDNILLSDRGEALLSDFGLAN